MERCAKVGPAKHGWILGTLALRLSSHADAAQLRLPFAHPSEIFERRRKQLMQLLQAVLGSSLACSLVVEGLIASL